MARKYFGTDGVRGTVGTDPITPDFVLKLGQSVGRVFSEKAGLSSGRFNRQRHPRFGLYVRGGFAGRLFVLGR